MADGLEFTTATRRKKPIKFTLDGDSYVFTPPKAASVIMPILESVQDGTADVRALLDYLELGLSEEDSKRIAARLRDPDDDLDIDTIETITKALMGKVDGRPTT